YVPPIQRLVFLVVLVLLRLRRHRIRHRADLRADVDGDDIRAFLRQPDRMTAALAARCAGDECDLALYPSSHCCSSASLACSCLACGCCPSLTGRVAARAAHERAGARSLAE